MVLSSGCPTVWSVRVGVEVLEGILAAGGRHRIRPEAASSLHPPAYSAAHCDVPAGQHASATTGAAGWSAGTGSTATVSAWGARAVLASSRPASTVTAVSIQPAVCTP